MGSGAELSYHLFLARDLDFLKNTEYPRLNSDLEEVLRMLCSLSQKSEMPWRLRGFRLKAKGQELKASNPKLVATPAFMLASKPVIAIRGHIV
jgi:hypothetical protein